MKIKIAIVSENIGGECERALMLRGFRTVTLPHSGRMSAAVDAHADMLIARLGGDYVTTADYCERAGCAISEIYDAVHPRFHFTADVHEEEYPRDVILNCLVLGKRVFTRKNSTSPYLLELAESLGYKIVNVNQGYPACTVLKLSDEAVITADRGMARVLREHGVRVYVIDDGGIMLEPHEYGFIGGAGGVYDGVAYFLGDVSRHPSYGAILRALECEGLTHVSLSGGALCDLGGILFAEGDLN